MSRTHALLAVSIIGAYALGCGSSGGGSLPPAVAQSSALSPNLPEPGYRLAITPQGRRAALPEWLPAGSQLEVDLLAEIDGTAIEGDPNGQTWGDWSGSVDWTVYVARIGAIYHPTAPSKLVAGVTYRSSKRILVPWAKTDCWTPGTPRLQAFGHEAGHGKHTIPDDHSPTCTPAKCPGLTQ